MEVELLLFIISFILEYVGAILVFAVFDSSCVMAGEVSIYVNVYIPLILPVLLSDLLNAIFRLCTEVHKEPLGTFFSLVNGILCIISGVSLVLVLIHFCGNPTLVVLTVAGVFTILAGISHFIGIRSDIIDNYVINDLAFRRSSGLFNI